MKFSYQNIILLQILINIKASIFLASDQTKTFAFFEEYSILTADLKEVVFQSRHGIFWYETN